jgi:hypothetical protein
MRRKSLVRSLPNLLAANAVIGFTDISAAQGFPKLAFRGQAAKSQRPTDAF